MVGNPRQIIQWLFAQDRNKRFEVTEYKEKRSLNANAYLWKLCTMIADELRTDKDSVYLQMLRDYGQSDLVSVRADINPVGLFKYYEQAGQSTLNNTLFTHYRVYRGSSEYNTKQMSILLDGVISEAKQLGIETMTPVEIARLKDGWR